MPSAIASPIVYSSSQLDKKMAIALLHKPVKGKVSEQLSSVSAAPQPSGFFSFIKNISGRGQENSARDIELLEFGKEESLPLHKESLSDGKQVICKEKKCLSGKKIAALTIAAGGCSLLLVAANHFLSSPADILPFNNSPGMRLPIDEIIYADAQPDSDMINADMETLNKATAATLPDTTKEIVEQTHSLAYSAYIPD